MERFEVAPDDNANWGKAIRMDQKLFKTESDEDDSSENEELNKKKSRFGPDASSSRARTGMFTFYKNKTGLRPLSRLQLVFRGPGFCSGSEEGSG